MKKPKCTTCNKEFERDELVAVYKEHHGHVECLWNNHEKPEYEEVEGAIFYDE